MISWVIWVMNVHQNAKKKPNKIRPPKSLKNTMSIFGLHSTSDDWPSDLSDERQPKHKKNKKGPLSHQKIKCSFLDYIQLLMIGQAIWVTNVNQNTKKTKKRPPKSSKNKMFIFGLHSTSDDWPSNLSDEHRLKCKKMKKSPLVIKKWNAHFWIMFNFWWSAEWSEWQNWTKMQKRPPKLSSGSLLCYLLVVLCVIFWWYSGSLLCYLLAVFCFIFFIIIINLVTLTLSSDNNKKKKITQKTARRLPEDHQNIIILVTLILSGGAVAMFYRV